MGRRPTGGYLTRQITFLLNNYVYKTDVQDDDNPGLYIPRYIASGRMAPNGKIYPEVKTKNEDELVPVRSIVTKRSGNLNVVSPDDFSVKFKQTNLSDGMAIGASLGTSLTENVTQSLLALKHGGHERTLSADGNFYAPKKCTFRTEGKWIYLKVYGGELKYPLPDNWVGVGKDKFNEGDLIGAAYNTTSPAYRLNAIIKCMRARGGNGVRYFEKDNVILGDCYAYEEGPIHYVETKKGDIEVFIGNRQYDYNPNCLYYFPEGATVKKYQRFCSGVVNMAHVMQDTNDISDSFNIFRRQFYALNNAKFEKTGIVEDDWMQEEILELVFAGMIDVKRNEKTGDIDELEYQGIHNSILNRDSVFTTLSYGYSSKVVAKALKGELAINNDIMTETVLGLLLNDKLDEN